MGRDEQGNLVRKAGIMGVVLAAGEVHAGDPIRAAAGAAPALGAGLNIAPRSVGSWDNIRRWEIVVTWPAAFLRRV
jgi:hypothetical protein